MYMISCSETKDIATMADYFKVGDTFTSFRDLQEKINNFVKDTWTPLYKRDSRKINNLRVRSKEVGKNVNEDLVYGEMKYCCIHGGRSESDTKYRKVTNQIECPFTICIRADRHGKYLRITKVVLEHNHAISKEMYEKLPSRCRQRFEQGTTIAPQARHRKGKGKTVKRDARAAVKSTAGLTGFAGHKGKAYSRKTLILKRQEIRTNRPVVEIVPKQEEPDVIVMRMSTAGTEGTTTGAHGSIAGTIMNTGSQSANTGTTMTTYGAPAPAARSTMADNGSQGSTTGTSMTKYGGHISTAGMTRFSSQGPTAVSNVSTTKTNARRTTSGSGIANIGLQELAAAAGIQMTNDSENSPFAFTQMTSNGAQGPTSSAKVTNIGAYVPASGTGIMMNSGANVLVGGTDMTNMGWQRPSLSAGITNSGLQGLNAGTDITNFRAQGPSTSSQMVYSGGQHPTTSAVMTNIGPHGLEADLTMRSYYERQLHNQLQDNTDLNRETLQLPSDNGSHHSIREASSMLTTSTDINRELLIFLERQNAMDEDDRFFLSMAAMCRRLPLDERINVRLRVHHTIADALHTKVANT